MYAGQIEARILTAALAETLGYEGDCVRFAADYKLFVNGFDDLEDLVGCTLVE